MYCIVYLGIIQRSFWLGKMGLLFAGFSFHISTWHWLIFCLNCRGSTEASVSEKPSPFTTKSAEPTYSDPVMKMNQSPPAPVSDRCYKVKVELGTQDYHTIEKLLRDSVGQEEMDINNLEKIKNNSLWSKYIRYSTLRHVIIWRKLLPVKSWALISWDALIISRTFPVINQFRLRVVRKSKIFWKFFIRLKFRI